ncbi:MAG: putative toxin-antitoxin system toxin component, PIN family [Rhizobium sp. 63-7]|nr:MAG: putative toxin-antitoxin system toxin component, PIN family [Rhizobium sp. 63-7]
MKRVVLDTNVLTAGLRSRNGASFVILKLIGQQRIKPLVTVSLFLEYEAVLKRPEQMSAHGLSELQVDQLLAGFLSIAEPIDVHFRWRPQLSDPKDELVLEAAVNGRAEVMLTHNLRDFEAVQRKFNLGIMRPSRFLELIRS